MKNIDFKKWLPYICAVVVFIGITLAFFSPVLLDDKALRQGDITQFSGSAHEIQQYREKNGTEPLWTNSMFGGMPAYQISTLYKGAFLMKFETIYKLFIPGPVGFVFISMLSFFILMLVIGVNPWLSIGGAIAFAFSSYNIVVLVAGHNTKVHALSYVPLCLAGVILLYRGKYLWGLAITALCLTLEVTANHLQITYYLFLITGFVVLVELIFAIREKTIKNFVISSSLLVLSGVLAVGANAAALWTTSEYATQTIRGKSDLASNKKSTGGLDIDYAFQWSYDKWETMNLLIPNFYGGSSDEPVDPDGDFAKALSSVGVPQQTIEQICATAPAYWGDQPFTAGPAYIGAVVIFLFVFGMVLINDKMKWWVLGAVIFAILVSWGKHFMGFNSFLFKHLPGFNKFRTVYMILVITEVLVPMWAVITVSRIIENKFTKEAMLRALKISAGVVGGLALLIALLGPSMFPLTSGDMDKDNLSRMFGSSAQQVLPTVLGGLKKERGNMMSMDAWRALALVIVAGGILWLFITGKIKKPVLIAGISILIVFDMGQIAKRYLKDNDFVDKVENESALTQLNTVDKYIQNDRSLDYRVLNLTVSYFQDATTSYYYKSIGGYHAAKLRRYNELNSDVIEGEINVMGKIINSHNAEGMATLFTNTPALNMLNTKYIILDKQNPPLMNPMACGNAWFVNEYKTVNGADEELAAIKNINPKTQCVVDKSYAAQLNGLTLNTDSTAKITLDSYEPNKLVYTTNNTAEGLAVFSEVYYNKGWNVTIDDKPVDYLRCNYVLRGLRVPAGKHKVEFTFAPSSYYAGEKISYASSFLILLLVGGAIFFTVRNRKEQNAA